MVAQNNSASSDNRLVQTGVSTMFPGTYVPRYLCSPNLCSPVPMFPGTYVPRYRCSPNLCSPVPMFPGTYVPRTYVPRYLCSPIYCKCVVGHIYVGLVIGIGIVGPQNVTFPKTKKRNAKRNKLTQNLIIINPKHKLWGFRKT